MSVVKGVPGWEEVAVGDICDAVNGRAFKSSEWRTTGVPIIRIENLKSPSAEFNYFQGQLDPRYEVSCGDILFAWSGTPGTSFGAHEWNRDRAALNQHIFRIDFDRSRIDRQFLMLALNLNVAGYIAQAHGGVGLGHITKSKFMQSRLPIPPLAEQRRIVAAIDNHLTRLDETVSTLGRVRRNLKRYRASVLKAAVEGSLVPTEAELARAEMRDYEPADVLLRGILAERWRRWEAGGKKGKYKAPAEPETANLPVLPQGWCWATADQLTDATRSITYGVIKLGAEVEGGVRVLRSSNVRHLLLDLGYVKPVSPKIESEYSRTRLRGGEVVVTVRGTLGGVAVVPSSCAGFNVSREVAVLSLIDEGLSEIVACLVGSRFLQTWMLTRTRGITYRGVNIETLKRLPIPLPPLAETRRIADRVAQLLSVGAAQEASLEIQGARLARLRQSILKCAFEGKLVDQDPNDEPASVLLERIKAERAAAALAPKSRMEKPRAKVTR